MRGGGCPSGCPCARSHPLPRTRRSLATRLLHATLPILVHAGRTLVEAREAGLVASLGHSLPSTAELAALALAVQGTDCGGERAFERPPLGDFEGPRPAMRPGAKASHALPPAGAGLRPPVRHLEVEDQLEEAMLLRAEM